MGGELSKLCWNWLVVFINYTSASGFGLIIISSDLLHALDSTPINACLETKLVRISMNGKRSSQENYRKRSSSLHATQSFVIFLITLMGSSNSIKIYSGWSLTHLAAGGICITERHDGVADDLREVGDRLAASSSLFSSMRNPYLLFDVLITVTDITRPVTECVCNQWGLQQQVVGRVASLLQVLVCKPSSFSWNQQFKFLIKRLCLWQVASKLLWRSTIGENI